MGYDTQGSSGISGRSPVFIEPPKRPRIPPIRRLDMQSLHGVHGYSAQMLLSKLEGNEKWQFAKEVSRLIEEQAEKVAFGAQVQKQIIEAWEDSDYEEMKVGRGQLEEDLKYLATILPLAEVHDASEKRKAKARGRLETAWGEDWEEDMAELMPTWPAEEFLRSLAVFAENNPEWENAERILRHRIAGKKASPKTKKYDFLMARDLVTAAVVSIQWGPQSLGHLSQHTQRVHESQRRLLGPLHGKASR